MRLGYLSHEYGGDPANLAAALRWLEHLRATEPDVVWIAPWVFECMARPETPETRVRGLRDDCEVVRRCDVLALCGPRMADGMKREWWVWSNAKPRIQADCRDWIGKELP